MHANARRPRILIVGCGDVGHRVVNLLGHRARIFALSRTHSAFASLREAGAVPIQGNLDVPETLWRIASLAPTVIHLAPPPPRGAADSRTRHLLNTLRGAKRLIYVSTSGVYGDCGGEEVDETHPLKPLSERAVRRVDAESVLRAWAARTQCSLSILRVPGIYGGQRMPTERLAAGTPALSPADDVYTNHIHADDLAQVIVAALDRAQPQRSYNASDDSALKMGDYFDLVAHAYGLNKPPRLSRAAVQQAVGAPLWSFMQESRRLVNRRLKEELSVRLAYPTVEAWLATDRAR